MELGILASGRLWRSAGAGISALLAFKYDMAEPKSRQTYRPALTRLCCAATIGGQSSYDPHVLKEWIGETTARHTGPLPAYGVKTYEELISNPKLQPLFDEVSAITH